MDKLKLQLARAEDKHENVSNKQKESREKQQVCIIAFRMLQGLHRTACRRNSVQLYRCILLFSIGAKWEAIKYLKERATVIFCHCCISFTILCFEPRFFCLK